MAIEESQQQTVPESVSGASGAAGRRTLRVTSPPLDGPDVRELQGWLSELGSTLAVDGVYGATTAAAVERFQDTAGLPVDGVVVPATWGALEISPSVRRAAGQLSGPVTAAALVGELLELHPEYGDGGAATLALDRAAGERAQAPAWLQRAREVVNPAQASQLHGRIVIAALARLDAGLRAQLEVGGFLAALHGEISEPGDDLFTTDAAPPSEVFDFIARAAADVPAATDVLGFGPLVDALYTLLDDERTSLPLALAVTAPWGAGKSSVMRQLKDRLDAPPTDGVPRRRWRTVHFEAWKYERSERLWAALAKAIYDQPLAQMGRLERWRFRVRLEFGRLGPRRLAAMTVWPALAAAAAVVAALSADLSPNGAALALLSTGAAGVAAATRYSGLVSDPFKRAIERHARRPDYESQLGFTAEANHDISILTRTLAPDDGPALAVFVDDLDRCSPAHVVEVVEAMNQIFNAAEHRCVFVLGLDRDVVATNIQVAYHETVEQLRAADNPLGERFGLEFPAKLVQLSVAIPQPTPAAIRDLLYHITGNPPPAEHAPEEAVKAAQAAIRHASDNTLSSVGDAAAKVESVAPSPEVMQEAVKRERAARIRDSAEVVAAEFSALAHLERNPRQVKRFHNAFRLQLYVANADDRVPFDFTADQLVALAKWVALRLRWPTLGDQLAREPILLDLIEANANGETLTTTLPNDDRKRLDTASETYLRDPAIRAVMTETNAARRVSALSLRAFLRVA